MTFYINKRKYESDSDKVIVKIEIGTTWNRKKKEREMKSKIEK